MLLSTNISVTKRYFYQNVYLYFYNQESGPCIVDTQSDGVPSISHNFAKWHRDLLAQIYIFK